MQEAQMDDRVWKIVGLVAVVGLFMGACVVVGGGLVYFLVRKTDVFPAVSVQDQVDPDYGLVIARVVPGGPADNAGVARGDILLEVDGEKLEANASLTALLHALPPGAEVTLTVLHGDDRRTLRATLGDRSGQAYLGVTLCIDSEVGRSDERSLVSRGARVVEVFPDTPAARAGLRADDIILAVNGEEVDEQHGLAALLAEYAPGDRVTLTINRSGEMDREVSVELGAHPDHPDIAYLGVRYAPWPGGEIPEGWRFPLEEFNFRFDDPELDLSDVEIQQGARIEEVVEGSPASGAGLSEGDVILSLGGDLVDGPLSLSNAVAGHQPGEKVMLLVIDPETGMDAEVQVELGENPEDAGRAYLGVRVSHFMRARGLEHLELPFGFEFNRDFQFHFAPPMEELPWNALPFDLDRFRGGSEFNPSPEDLDCEDSCCCGESSF
jgi:S1-C subfamily serine protease